MGLMKMPLAIALSLMYPTGKLRIGVNWLALTGIYLISFSLQMVDRRNLAGPELMIHDLSARHCL